MEIYCTRPDCERPLNFFADLDDLPTFKTTQQKYCTTCGMPLILAGRYFTTKLLGRGGFGTAYLAIDRYTPTLRKCVVKQFQPTGNLNAESMAIAQKLFEREAEVLEELGAKHQQIPDLYAFFPLFVANRKGGSDEQFFYLVQEFIDGQTLEEKLATKGVFPEAEVKDIVREILKVLQFVHHSGTIHRDIKPSNIMQHKNGLYYLLDFGAVKQVAKSVGSPQGRSTGIYSVGYAPPEQMTGAQVYPATDLYALGVTAIHLLSGKLPEDLYDAYHNTWTWQKEAPSVSDRFALFLNRLLQSSPKDRYASADEALQALTGGQTVSPSTTQIQPSTIPQAAVQPVPTPSPSGALSPPPARISRFSTVEQIKMAGFTGFEGALLAVGLKSWVGMPGIVVACMLIGGLFFCQWRRIIEGSDFVIIGGISLGLMVIPLLRGGLAFPVVAAIALVSASALVAVFVLFKLIYSLISRIL